MADGFSGAGCVEVSGSVAHPRRYWSVIAFTQRFTFRISLAFGFGVPFRFHKSEFKSIAITLPFRQYKPIGLSITIFIRVSEWQYQRHPQSLTQSISQCQ